MECTLLHSGLLHTGTRMKADHESLTSHGSSGIAFTDEESIIAHLDNFCNHIRSMIDIIHTLSQFSKLASDVRNLPRVQRDVVISSMSPDEDLLGGDAHLKVMTGDVTHAGGVSVEGGSEHSYPTEGIVLLDYWDMLNFLTSEDLSKSLLLSKDLESNLK